MYCYYAAADLTSLIMLLSRLQCAAVNMLPFLCTGRVASDAALVLCDWCFLSGSCWVIGVRVGCCCVEAPRSDPRGWLRAVGRHLRLGSTLVACGATAAHARHCSPVGSWCTPCLRCRRNRQNRMGRFTGIHLRHSNHVKCCPWHRCRLYLAFTYRSCLLSVRRWLQERFAAFLNIEQKMFQSQVPHTQPLHLPDDGQPDGAPCA